jgi:putative sterol carrier protein
MSRRTVLRSASQVPPGMVDEVVDDMATRMRGSAEARSCEGLSFVFEITDIEVQPARYAIGARGAVRLSRGAAGAATFHFTGPAEAFDGILRGQHSALAAILGRRIRLHGSLFHLRQILRMMPAVHRAYNEARDALIDRHADDYDFRF